MLRVGENVLTAIVLRTAYFDVEVELNMSYVAHFSAYSLGFGCAHDTVALARALTRQR